MSFVKKKYEIRLEVEGDMAMWRDPTSNVICPITYPVITPTAAVSLFESILFYKDKIKIVMQKINVCKPIQYYEYAFNYNGPLRKSKNIKNENAQQIKNTVLYDVCYQIFAEVENINKTKINYAHAYQEEFMRCLKNGKIRRPMYLGVKEFGVNYYGNLRERTRPCDDINIYVKNIAKTTFSEGGFTRNPERCDCKVEKGILKYVDCRI